MRNLKYLLTLAAVLAGISVLVLAADAAPAKITGEIIDSSCYIKMGAKGSGHADCATTCAKAGIPLALLEDGTNKVVWLAANKDAMCVNDQLMSYIAKKVTLTGKWSERGGAKLFSIDKIEPAAGKPAASD